jgi:bacteriocin biosynthesis cyclodehydratase domain-containing protein
MLRAMRPILRPGTHVLRRPAGRLQVGLAPETALLLPDAPVVRGGLGLLSAAAAAEEHEDRSVLDLLTEHDLVVDESAVTPLLTGGDLERAEAAARARSLGEGAAAGRTARRALRPEVLVSGPPVARHLEHRLAEQLAVAGIGSGPPSSGGPPGLRCGVALAVGELPRELVDPWTRAGTPYVAVRMVEGAAVLGPFVGPGSTACLRCVDAHHTDADPAWPLLVRQHHVAASRDRADGVPEPLDPLLAEVALAWLVRDLATYADGRRPATWSSTVTLDPHLEQVRTRAWLRHPACGCAWSSGRRGVASDTMGE